MPRKQLARVEVPEIVPEDQEDKERMTVRLPSDLMSRLHRYCIGLSSEEGRMVSYNQGIKRILQEHLPDSMMDSNPPAPKRKSQPKPLSRKSK